MKIMYEGIVNMFSSTSWENFKYLIERMLLSNYTIKELHDYIIIGDLKIDPKHSRLYLKGYGKVNAHEAREYLALLDEYGREKALEYFKILRKEGLRIDYFSNYSIFIGNLHSTFVRLQGKNRIIETTSEELPNVLTLYKPKGPNKYYFVYDHIGVRDYTVIQGFPILKISSTSCAMYFTKNPFTTVVMPIIQLEIECSKEIKTFQELATLLELEKTGDWKYESKTHHIIITKDFTGFDIHYKEYLKSKNTIPKKVLLRAKTYGTEGPLLISKTISPYKILYDFKKDAVTVDDLGRPVVQAGWAPAFIPLPEVIYGILF